MWWNVRCREALRRLEERIGVGLVNRTTRNVQLTEAGRQLCVIVSDARADSVAEGYDTSASTGVPRRARRHIDGNSLRPVVISPYPCRGVC